MTAAGEAVGGSASAIPMATRVFRSGNVVTMDPQNPAATALALFGDRMVAVGTDEAMAEWTGRGTEVVDLDGRTVLPGFIDAHTHVASNADDPRNVDVRDFYDPSVVSVEEILRRMRSALRSTSPGEWIVGTASPLADLRLLERRLPTRDELDSAVDGRPAYITFGPHLTLASSAALEAAHIGPDNARASDGTIETGDDGAPNGYLREAAQRLVKLARPDANLDLDERIRIAAERCARRGVTTIHDVVIHPDEVRSYQRLEAAGRLRLNIRLLVRSFQSAFQPRGLHDLGLLTGFGTPMVSIGGVKLSVDGGFDQGIFEPGGEDDRHLHPVLRMTQAELDELVELYHRDGMRLCVHVSGDGALRSALASFERALALIPRPGHRHRLEHMGNYAMTAAHVDVARRLGLTPVPNTSELYFMGRTAERVLGSRRTARAFALRWLLDAGFPLVLASDGGGLWPVDPLRDMRAAVTRECIDGGTVADTEAITPDEALPAYTTAAAWGGFEEDRTGMLRPGRQADLVLLSADPRTTLAAGAAQADVLATVVGGRVSHSWDALLAEEF